MQIRRAEAADEEALASIRRRAILALAVPAMSREQAERWATRGAADRVARAMREHDVWVAVPTERLDDRECVLVHLDGTSLPDNVYEECDVMTLSDQLGEAIEHMASGNTMATSTV